MHLEDFTQDELDELDRELRAFQASNGRTSASDKENVDMPSRQST
jgi:hypothetical protein